MTLPLATRNSMTDHYVHQLASIYTFWHRLYNPSYA